MMPVLKYCTWLATLATYPLYCLMPYKVQKLVAYWYVFRIINIKSLGPVCAHLNAIAVKVLVRSLFLFMEVINLEVYVSGKELIYFVNSFL